MKSLSLSGGGTKVSAIAGAAVTLCKDKKYKPDLICGVSAGSLLAIPLAMEMYEEIELFSTSFRTCDVFNISPLNKNGKISFWGLLRAIFGKQSFGDQKALMFTYSEFITEEIFEKYKTGKYAPCYLGTVEFKTGKRVYWDVKNMEYLDFLDVVLASSSVPVFVESVKIEDEYYYDGGVRDHIGSHWLMENFDIKENISIYSRPEDYKIEDLDWKPKNILAVLDRTFSITNIEISKNDELREDELVDKKGIKNKKIFMPKVLSTNMYEINPEKLKEWYSIGKKSLLEQY